MEASRRTYPSDVTDEEWSFVLPYLLLLREDARQRQYALRELFSTLRYVVRTGCTWRYLPHDLPPWATCYQQWARWRDARVFEALTDDLRQLLRLHSDRPAAPRAVILDSRTLTSTPESGHRAGYDGAKRRKGSKVHVAVVTPANAQDRAQVSVLAQEVQVSQANRLRWLMPTKATRGTSTPKRSLHRVPTCRSSSYAKPSVATAPLGR